MYLNKEICKKAVTLMIAAIFIISAFIPAVSSQIGQTINNQSFKESEDIVAQYSYLENSGESHLRYSF